MFAFLSGEEWRDFIPKETEWAGNWKGESACQNWGQKTLQQSKYFLNEHTFIWILGMDDHFWSPWMIIKFNTDYSRRGLDR